MYTSALDRDAALLVARLAPGRDEAQDFPEHIERMVSACDDTAELAENLCILVLFERAHSLPSPKIRKAVADATARETFHPHLAIVTSNPLVRGVITAISWLRKPDFEIKLLATTSEAITWLEQQRGESLPQLENMVAEVMGESEQAGQSVSNR